jgi:hypothetical protein
MKTYRFVTSCTIKKYNSRKWWIDSGIVRPMEIEADTYKEAFTIWADSVMEEYGIGISNSAIRNKEPMYRDGVNGSYQCGYVVTGSMEFDRDDYSGYCKQYIDLWVEIKTVQNIDFSSAEA